MLDLVEMLGCYPPRDGYEQLEFQIGRTLVWVSRPMSWTRAYSVQCANRFLPPCWEDRWNALRLAGDVCAASESGEHIPYILRLMSITIRPESNVAEYDVALDDEGPFDCESNDVDTEIVANLPAGLSSETLIVVRRSATGGLSAG